MKDLFDETPRFPDTPRSDSKRLTLDLTTDLAGAGYGTFTSSPHLGGLTFPVANADPPIKLDKGHFDGSCNRTACQRPLAGNNWFNRWTIAYYCQSCALKINDADGGDSNLVDGRGLPCRRVAKPVTTENVHGDEDDPPAIC